MEKRLILAVALSLMVLLIWSAISPKPKPIESQGVALEERVSIAQNPVGAAPKEASIEAIFTYKQDNFELTFIEPWAAVKEVTFKNHQDYVFPLERGFWIAEPGLDFKRLASSSDEVIFEHKDVYKSIVKKFIFSNPNNDIWLEVTVQNLSTGPLVIELPLLLGVMGSSTQNIESRYQLATIASEGKAKHYNAKKGLDFDKVEFLGIRDRYFCAIIDPEKDVPLETKRLFGHFKRDKKIFGQSFDSAFIKKLTPVESEVGLYSSRLSLEPGQISGHLFHIYLGPQDIDLLNNIKPDWTSVVNYGKLDFISQLLLQLLRFFYGIIHNWGWAIILLSIVVYFVLFPLALKQMRSMKEMQLLQPKIEGLRKTYKDNPQRINKEIMELYREHKVNPLGGCLPLLLQMPIFFALYQALMRSVALKGANFLWIKDLSEPDRLFILSASLPIIGNEINILPIVMAVGMLIQQKISASKVSNESAQQQKMMTVIFPVIFGFIFYRMPSGLVLYWLINSILMLIFQIRMNQIKNE